MSAQVDPESIGTLTGDSEPTISLSITANATGRGRGRLAVDGQRRESVEFRIEVLDTADFLTQAVSITERLLNDVDDRTSGRGDASSDIQNRLTEI